MIKWSSQKCMNALSSRTKRRYVSIYEKLCITTIRFVNICTLVQKIYNRGNTRTARTTRQMKGWWESNINVWFRFMYSKKLKLCGLVISKTEL
jgi:hypothetical protein